MSIIIIPTESSTLTLNGYNFKDFVDGDKIILTPFSEATSQTASENGGTTINERVTKDMKDLAISIQKYTDDDKFLNGLVNAQPITIIDGTLKQSITKDGLDVVDTYILAGGSMTVQPTDTRNNQDGNNVMIYTVRFRSAIRT